MSLLALAGTNSATGSYEIDNSLKFEADNTEYLSKTPSSAGNQKTWTFSAWVKRTELGLTSSKSAMIFGSGDTYLHFISNDKLVANLRTGGTNFFYYSERMFRDTSAWYHFVLACDTTQSTAADRLKLYVNGVYESPTESNGYTNIAQNADTGINSTNEHEIGKYTLDETTYAELFSGYMAEMHLVDGTALAPTDFGEFDQDSGIWKPKAYTGSYGTNGFYLDFESSGSLGADSSVNNNNWTLNNITAADQATDTPTNNFCTLNILNASSKNAGGNNEYTEGATKGKALQESEMASGTMAVTQGKWYYECKAVSNSEIMAGWGVPNLWGHHTANPGYDDYSFAVHNIGRVYYSGNAYIDLSPSVSFDTNDIISCAIDIDNGFCYWAKNGTWMNGGSPTSGATGTGGFDFQSASAPGNLAIEDGDFLVPAFRTNYYTNSAILVNFGGYTTISISSAASDADGYGTFEYAPPSGYYALCTKNLEEYG